MMRTEKKTYLLHLGTTSGGISGSVALERERGRAKLGQVHSEPSRAARRDTPAHLELDEVLVLGPSVACRALLPWTNDLLDTGLAADVPTFLEGTTGRISTPSPSCSAQKSEGQHIRATRRECEGLTLLRTDAMLFESSFEHDGHIIAAEADFDPADDAAAAGGRGVNDTDTSLLMLRREERPEQR